MYDVYCMMYDVDVEDDGCGQQQRGRGQCDQMARFSFQYWAIWKIENVSISLTIWQRRYKILTKNK